MHAWLRVCLGATLEGRRQRVLCCQAWGCANVLGVCHGVGRPHTGFGRDRVLVSGAQLGLCGCVSNMGQSACSINRKTSRVACGCALKSTPAYVQQALYQGISQCPHEVCNCLEHKRPEPSSVISTSVPFLQREIAPWYYLRRAAGTPCCR